MSLGRRTTIGVIASPAEDAFNLRLQIGMGKEFARHGIRTVALLMAAGAEVFESALAARVDGVVIANASGAGLDRCQQRYGHLPGSCIGARAGDWPGVCVDSEKGMRRATEHLISAGRRHLAFVRGPSGHREAERRFAGFRTALREAGLEFDDVCVAPGAFSGASGESAIRLLWDERGVRFDGLVAANDSSAQGAVTALKRRGVRVPEDVAIVGFDDLLSARQMDPSLTTVRQPVEELGRVAADLVVRQLRGEAYELDTMLPTRLIVRQSTGYGPSGDSQVPAPSRSDCAPAERLSRLLARLLELPSSDAAELVHGLLEGPAGAEKFLASVRLALRPPYVGRLVEWGEVSALLRQATGPCGDRSGSPGRLGALDGRLSEVLLSAADTQRDREAMASIESVTAVAMLSDALALVKDARGLRLALEEARPTYPIGARHIVALDGSNVAQLAYSSQLRCEEGALPRFQMNQVLPAELWDEPRWNSLSIYPLAAGGDSLGAMICEGPPEHHVTYTFMGVQLVAALRRFSTLSLVPGVSDGSTASAVTPPTQMVGRYRILRRLGAGGAASVYLAEADVMPGVARRMALKLLHFRPDAGDWARHAAEEARIAASIHHPNVVPVLEVGEDNSQVYLVMEYVEGDSLASIVARQRQGAERMPLRIVARILVDVLAGLHAAHELRDHAGIALHLVHRDVAPKNILVGLDGVSRLTDFGIAKTRNTTDPTALGVVKGTVRYMAPEQAMGRPLDRRADLWAIGVMAWELLACRRLYEGDVDAAVLLKLVNEPIPELGKLAPDVPEPASKWVSALLQKDPRGRLGTASAARAALFGAWETLGGVADTDEVASFMCDLLNAKKPAPSPSGAPTNAV